MGQLVSPLFTFESAQEVTEFMGVLSGAAKALRPSQPGYVDANLWLLGACCRGCLGMGAREQGYWGCALQAALLQSALEAGRVLDAS